MEDPSKRETYSPETDANEKPSYSIPAHQPATNYNKDNVGVKLNGSFVTLDPQARIINGSTFIPLRGVLEKMGAKVTWHQQTRGITITKDSTTIKLTVDSKTAYVNDQKRTLTTAPFIINGSTYVPLRFVSEMLGEGWVESRGIHSEHRDQRINNKTGCCSSANSIRFYV